MVHDDLLRELDLNLLRALLALLDAGSVTTAAKRVGLTQPAMSRSLDRLRHALGDPLFVKSGRGLAPTPRALALHEPLRRTFASLRDELLVPPVFDPATSTRRFVVEGTDYVDLLLLPRLVRALATRAPGVSLRLVRPWTGIPHSEIDLRLHPAGQGEIEGAYEVLFEEGFVLAARRGHPVIEASGAGDRLDARRLARLPQVLVAPQQGTRAIVDDRLAEQGLGRRIALLVPSFSAVPQVLAATDLVAVLPERLARAVARKAPLALRAIPLSMPKVRALASYHPRFARDPGALWLRAEVRRIAAGTHGLA